MEAEVSIISSQRAEAKRNISIANAMDMLTTIQQQCGWDVKKMLDDVKASRADCVSISKDNPDCSLLIRSCIRDIAVCFTKKEKEIKLMLPKDKPTL